MIDRFDREEQGYGTWLTDNPDGWVLNTYAHVAASPPVIHRARCRTVDRSVRPGRNWTYPYGKACSRDRAELEAWALSSYGQTAQPCGICLRSSSRSRARGVPVRRNALGPRVPRPVGRPIEMEGEGVTIRIHPMHSLASGAPPLIIEGAQWLAEAFFVRDPSAAVEHSYDQWIRDTQGNLSVRDRIVDGDITAVNATMAARTSHKTWARVIAKDKWAWLAALDPSWDLFQLSESDWDRFEVEARLGDAFGAVHGRGLQIAVATKVLHIKRPRLIPVLDSLVIGQVGGRASKDVATWVSLARHIRDVGRANLPGLVAIHEHLAAKGLEDRSLVRILDSLLWTCAPGSALFGQLDRWERLFRPRQSASDVGL